MNFALIGAAGYIAEKHVSAIKNIDGTLVVAYDIVDSVGMLDKYFPECQFYTNEKDFREFLSLFEDIDYLVICSPNYLHAQHIKIGIDHGIDVICEKPMFIDPTSYGVILNDAKNINIYPMLQYRYAAEIVNKSGDNDVVANYTVSRGPWYEKSWKGDPKLSGGINFNIGAHMFDIATVMLGPMKNIVTYTSTDTVSMGLASMERGRFHWFLSVNGLKMNHRRFWVNGETHSLPAKDLHLKAYDRIAKGYGIELGEMADTMKFLFALKEKDASRD
jgi:UDP-N-acetyl-2-amino-2-deoxyglucuronate dehydrogenase